MKQPIYGLFGRVRKTFSKNKMKAQLRFTKLYLNEPQDV